MKLFIFPIENWGRELDSKLFIHDNLLRFTNETIVCVFAAKNLINLAMKYGLGNTVVLHKSLQEKFGSDIREYKKNGGVYCFIEEEHFDRSVPLNARFGSNVPQLCDCAFASTLDDYESLISVIKKKNVVLSGNPRNDVFLNNVNVYKADVQKIIRKCGNYILFSSNFSFLFPPKGHALENLDAEGIYENDDDRVELHNFIKQHIERGKETIKFLIDFASTSDCSVIYRPHPNESLSAAKQAFSSSRVLVVRDDNIFPWLIGAQEVLHCGCNTAIEYSLLGKVPIFLLPLPRDKGSLIYEVSLIANELGSVAEIINRKNKSPLFHNNNIVLQQLPSSQLQEEASSAIAKKLLEIAPEIGLKGLLKNASVLFRCYFIFLIAYVLSPKERARITSLHRRSFRRILTGYHSYITTKIMCIAWKKQK
jgi:surface carbohydrate biosynthesis protein